MAVTVTDRRETIDPADTTTGWTNTSGGTLSAVTNPAGIENGICLGEVITKTNGATYHTHSTSIDCDSSNTGNDQESSTAKTFNGMLVFMWVFQRGAPLLTANGGLGVTVGDGTNIVSYYVAGSDKKGFSHDSVSPYFQCMVIDTNSAELPTAKGTVAGSEASMSWGALTQFGGWADNGAEKAVGGVENYFWDAVRVGNHGIRIAGGGSTTQGNLAEVVATDSASSGAWGGIREYSSGVYGCQLGLTFGDNGTGTSYFEDSEFTLVFEDRPVADDKFFIDVEGNSTGTNSFVIKNGTIQSAGPAVTIDFDRGNIDTLTIENVLFSSTKGNITWSSNVDASGHTSLSNTFTSAATITNGLITINDVTQDTCIFNSCGQIVVDGSGDLDSCVINKTTNSVSMVKHDPTNASISNCEFLGETTNKHAVELTAVPSTLSWSNTQDSNFATGTTGTNITTSSNGDEAIYINPPAANSTTITINVAAGATVPSVRKGTNYTGQVNVNISYDFTITGLELNTEVTIVTSGTDTELFHVEDATTSDGNGKYQVVYTHSGGETVDVLIHEKSYQPEISNIYGLTLPSSDSSAKVQMFQDLNYFNP